MEEQGGDFYPITYGKAYRSAQLDRDEFEYYIKKFNVKSIVNLHSENPDAHWYREKTNISTEHI
jgi:hypothetical protein